MRQREIPIMSEVTPPQFAPASVIESFTSYRDAVIWCWENRPCHGMKEALDQALCAKVIGLYAPHMSRCLNRNSKAPMKLDPDYLRDFEAYTGWKAASQFIAARSCMTILEQVISEQKTDKFQRVANGR